MYIIELICLIFIVFKVIYRRNNNIREKITTILLTGVLVAGTGLTALATASSNIWDLNTCSIEGLLTSNRQTEGPAKTTIRKKQNSSTKAKVAIWAYNSSGVVDSASKKYGTAGATTSTVSSYSKPAKIWESMHSVSTESALRYR